MLQTRTLFLNNCIQVKDFHEAVTMGAEMAAKMTKEFFY